MPLKKLAHKNFIHDLSENLLAHFSSIFTFMIDFMLGDVDNFSQGACRDDFLARIFLLPFFIYDKHLERLLRNFSQSNQSERRSETLSKVNQKTGNAAIFLATLNYPPNDPIKYFSVVFCERENEKSFCSAHIVKFLFFSESSLFISDYVAVRIFYCRYVQPGGAKYLFCCFFIMMTFRFNDEMNWEKYF